MVVAVVYIRVVRVSMRDRLVPMHVRVRLGAVPGKVVRMQMMRIVCVRVLVRHGMMRMFVLVPLGQVQPNPRRHQRGCQPEASRDRFLKCTDGDGSSHEWGRREIRRRPG